MIFPRRPAQRFLASSFFFFLHCLPFQRTKDSSVSRRRLFYFNPSPNMSFFSYPTQISVSEDDGACGGFKSCLYVPLDGSCTLSKHSTESKLYSLPLNPSLEMNYICSNWKLFFIFISPPLFFFSLFLWRTMSPECVLAPFSPGSFLLSLLLFLSQLYPPSLFSHPIFLVFVIFRRTLQTVGPSHARTYTVAVYFKGERIGCGKGPRWVKTVQRTVKTRQGGAPLL